MAVVCCNLDSLAWVGAAAGTAVLVASAEVIDGYGGVAVAVAVVVVGGSLAHVQALPISRKAAVCSKMLFQPYAPSASHTIRQLFANSKNTQYKF